MQNFIAFPNLEKYSISYLKNIFSANQIFVAQKKDDKTDRIILLYNLEQDNLDNILAYFNDNQIDIVTTHNNIIKIHEIGTTYHGFSKYLYLVMDIDFVEFQSLENAFSQNNMSEKKSMTIICQALEGLNHFHKHNVIHKNIATDNILFFYNQVKLSDYHLSFTPFIYNKNRQKTFLSYKPPEFFCTPTHCNYLSDIYSLGIVLFRCVNQFDSWLDIIDPIDNLPELVRTGQLINYIGYQYHVSPDIKKIINKACGCSNNNYYSNVLELKQDLKNTYSIKSSM